MGKKKRKKFLYGIVGPQRTKKEQGTGKKLAKGKLGANHRDIN